MVDQVLDILKKYLPPNRVRLFSFPPLASSSNSWVRAITEQPWKSWTIVTREKDWDVLPRIVGQTGGVSAPLKNIFLPPIGPGIPAKRTRMGGRGRRRDRLERGLVLEWGVLGMELCWRRLLRGRGRGRRRERTRGG